MKSWRQRAAGNQPLYTVANNRTLEAIADAKPADVDELLKVDGVGRSFVAKHAQAVLAVIAQG